MNLLIAVVLFTGFVTLYGADEVKDGAIVASVSECVVPASQAASKTDVHGLRPQDPGLCSRPPARGPDPVHRRQPINGTADVGKLIRPRVGEPTAIVVLRDGAQKSLQVSPIRNTVQQVGPDGDPAGRRGRRPFVMEAGFLGVSSAPVGSWNASPSPSCRASSVTRWAHAGVLLHIPQRMTDVAQAAFGSEARDPNGRSSVVGVGRMAGEIASGSIGDLDRAGRSPRSWCSLLAGLNIALFVFNLIPLLPLDGGHVAGALWEGLKRKSRGWLHRPDPGHVDVAKALPVVYAVSSVLIAMSLLLIYADIVKPVKLG